VHENEHALKKKKGVGQGGHQSDVIRLTMGWLVRTMVEYWNGEPFMKQVFQEGFSFPTISTVVAREDDTNY